MSSVDIRNLYYCSQSSPTSGPSIAITLRYYFEVAGSIIVILKSSPP